MRPILRRLEILKNTHKEHKLCKDDFRRIIAVKKLLPNMTILVDVGCFDGTITRMLAHGKKATVIGLELSKEAAYRAKKKIDDVIICDVEESLPLKDGSVDCLFAGEIIEHLFDPDYFLRRQKGF